MVWSVACSRAWHTSVFSSSTHPWWWAQYSMLMLCPPATTGITTVRWGLSGHQVWLHFLEGLFLLKDAKNESDAFMSRKVNFRLRCLIHVFSMSFGRFAQHHRHLLWSENTTTLSIGTSAAFDNWKLAALTNMSHIKVMGIFHLLLSYIAASYHVHQRKKLRDVRSVSNRRS